MNLRQQNTGKVEEFPGGMHNSFVLSTNMAIHRNVPHAMNGSLADIHAAELVLNIYESGLSGRLRFTQNKMRRDVYFRKGDIIFAHSSLPQERLGEILIRLGKIGAEEFSAVVREVADGKRLGETLVERGYISTMDLYVGLNYQVQHILYSVFDWDFGLYEFEEEIRNVQQEIAVRVSTADLVVRGVRNITNLKVLDRAMGDDENRIVFQQRTPRLRRTDFDYQEETVLSCLDGKTSIHELRKVSKLTSLEFGRAIFGLLLSGMIGFHEEGHHEISEDPRKWSLNLFEPEVEPAQTVLPKSIEIPPVKIEVEEYPMQLAPTKPAQIKTPRPEEPFPAPAGIYSDHDALDAPIPLPVMNEQERRASIEYSGEMTLKELEEASTVNPVDVDLLRNFGKKLQQAGRAREGEKQLLRALEIEPRNLENHFALADFYQAQGLKLKAFTHLNSILQLDPNNKRALSVLGVSKRKSMLYQIERENHQDGKNTKFGKRF